MDGKLREKVLYKDQNLDGIIQLALIHHLTLAKNIPLEDVIRWLTSLAPSGLIEFVPKEDPTSRIMLLGYKGDIFPNYNGKKFSRYFI